MKSELERLREENRLLRSELEEHARLAGAGSEREARLLTQLEECRQELRNVLGSVPVTTVAFTGDYGLYFRMCLSKEREAICDFLRSEPEKIVECDGHRHKDGKSCIVFSPMTLEDMIEVIREGKYNRSP